MQRWIPILLVALAVACSEQASPPASSASEAPTDEPVQSVAKGAHAADAATRHAELASPDDLNAVPPVACDPDNYVQFVNAFAQFPAQRSHFVTAGGRAQLGGFDIALVDYRWQREPDGVALEVEITRHGGKLDVTATPVERDEDDTPIRTLGPTRRYAFEHIDGCWRYAGFR